MQVALPYYPTLPKSPNKKETVPEKEISVGSSPKSEAHFDTSIFLGRVSMMNDNYITNNWGGEQLHNFP